MGSVRGDFDCAIDGPRAFDSDAAFDLSFDLFGSGANQQRQSRLVTQRLLQHRVVAALIFAAEDDQNPPGNASSAFSVASTFVALESL